ncbi:MAG: hypothetical protein HGA45_40045 [Chloroflexales bacterium]|nr:hypothetical protein [Chloroflexales bacterium]
MTRERDERYPTDAFGLPEGLLAAVAGWLLLVGVFAFTSSATPMPPAERWAALTVFTLLAAGATLPGCATLYDGLGRVVRRDVRAELPLLALVPALYIAYAFVVRELTLTGFASACFFAAVPALAFWRSGHERQPTIFDALGLSYLAVSLWLGLLPTLMLPQQGGLVGFFQLASVPLLLLLFAARGWPGVGYTWHLSLRELRDAALAGLTALAVLLLVGLATGRFGMAARAPTAGGLILAAVSSYFFTALPIELLLRGGIQRGLERALAPTMGNTSAWVALALAAGGWAALGMLRGGWFGALFGLSIGVAAGWTFLRTGKVTAAAVAHALVALALDTLTNL